MVTNKLIIIVLSMVLLCNACTPVATIPVNNIIPIAFPGAEGFGKYTTGGRGGKVYVITNLNDDGEGSLREALNRSGARIIVFAVSGTIHLLSPLNIKANTTIAGQTAPGEGICIADHPVKLDGNNIIIRYMRFRMGDRYQNQGMIHGAGHDDALSAYKKKNIIIDHCSISWSTDEVLSVYGGDSTTLQWNFIAEPLNYSYHFERGGTDFQQHGYGGIWGGRNLSAHHNLFAHCVSRTPRFDGTRNIENEFVDFRNNVIYNWGSNNVYAGEGGKYNIINNYYKPGPDTKKNVAERILNPFKKEPDIPFGIFYVDGNVIEGSPEVNKNNWLGVIMNNGNEEDKAAAKVLTAFEAVYIQTQTAVEAYTSVLEKAGASFRRDSLDQRIISNVKNKTGNIIDVQGGFPHGTSYEVSKTAWPVLRTRPAIVDMDNDGIPDDWERKNGLNPNDAADASHIKLHPYYSNIELYINSLTD